MTQIGAPQPHRLPDWKSHRPKTVLRGFFGVQIRIHLPVNGLGRFSRSQMYTFKVAVHLLPLSRAVDYQGAPI